MDKLHVFNLWGTVEFWYRLSKMLLIHLKKFVVSVKVGVIYIIRLGGNDVSEIQTDRKVFIL